MHLKPLAFLVILGYAFAERPADTSVCDFYANALLKENKATTQVALLTLVVNMAIIGNYSDVNVGVKVPGILAPGTYNRTAVNLLPYFSGGLASTNNGGRSGEVQNFPDGGGASLLMMNMAANGTSSNQ
jgi:hypothetical protein